MPVLFDGTGEVGGADQGLPLQDAHEPIEEQLQAAQLAAEGRGAEPAQRSRRGARDTPARAAGLTELVDVGEEGFRLDADDLEDQQHLLEAQGLLLVQQLAEVAPTPAHGVLQPWGRPYPKLKLRWLIAVVEGRLGHWGRAEEVFLEVRKGLAKLGLGYEVGMVSIDLGFLYLAQGRRAELKALAHETAAIFRRIGVEAKARVLFRHADPMPGVAA